MAWKRDDEHLIETYTQFVKDVLSPKVTEGFDNIGIYGIYMDINMYMKQIVQSFNSSINYYICFNEFGVTYYEDFETYYHILVYCNGCIHFSPQFVAIPDYIEAAKNEIEPKLDEYVINLYKELHRLDIKFKEAHF